jgi:L-ribulose-5-phosphate 3-epimerase
VSLVLAATTNCYHPYNLDDALRGIAAAGFRSVELAALQGWAEHVPVVLQRRDQARIRENLDQHGLTPVALSGHSDLVTKKGVDYTHAAIDATADLGIPILTTGVGQYASGEEDRRQVLANIPELAEHASARGVTIALEVLSDLMGTGKQAADLVEQIDHTSVRINYDTGNCTYYGGVKAEDDIQWAIPLMVHCHAKDKVGGTQVWDFPPIGQGEVDFERVIEALKAGGYRGAITVEVEFKGDPWPAIEEVDDALRQSHEYLSALLSRSDGVTSTS